jgi:hypothetical protein
MRCTFSSLPPAPGISERFYDLSAIDFGRTRPVAPWRRRAQLLQSRKVELGRVAGLRGICVH